MPSPRLLVDGCWFSRPYGGVTRVWQQILSTFQLPGFMSDSSPFAIINRNCKLSLSSKIYCIESNPVDPTDPNDIAKLASDNGRIVGC